MHSDRHRSSFNLTLILALGVAAVGLFEGGVLLVVGLTVAAFSWLTTPSQYAIFNDRLMIAYGRPRVRHIPFRQVNEVDLLSLPIGNRLRLRLHTGRALFIQPLDPDQFQAKLESALDSYRGHQGGEDLVEGS